MGPRSPARPHEPHEPRGCSLHPPPHTNPQGLASRLSISTPTHAVPAANPLPPFSLLPPCRGPREAAGEEIREELWATRHQEADLLHRRHEHARGGQVRDGGPAHPHPAAHGPQALVSLRVGGGAQPEGAGLSRLPACVLRACPGGRASGGSKCHAQRPRGRRECGLWRSHRSWGDWRVRVERVWGGRSRTQGQRPPHRAQTSSGNREPRAAWLSPRFAKTFNMLKTRRGAQAEPGGPEARRTREPPSETSRWVRRACPLPLRTGGAPRLSGRSTSQP